MASPCANAGAANTRMAIAIHADAYERNPDAMTTPQSPTPIPERQQTDRLSGPGSTTQDPDLRRSCFQARERRGGGVSGADNRSSGIVGANDGVTSIDAGCATETGVGTSALPTVRNAGTSEEQPQASRAPVSVCGSEWW